MSFRSNVFAATFVAAAALLSASSAQAQGDPKPDTVTTNRLPAIVSTAELENIFRRFWNMQENRQTVIDLERGNRQLERQLAEYDRRIVRLETKLDSLKAREAEMQRQIQMIDSAAAATRAARLALEARLRPLEETVAKGGGR